MTFAQDYLIDEKIGRGAFGHVYKARRINKKDGESFVALKVEDQNQPLRLLTAEANVLQSMQGQVGFPKMHELRTVNGVKVLVTELLGSSIQQLYLQQGKKFSLQSLLMMADQMICRLEALHSQGFVHRDLKPENFLIGRDKNAVTVYLIDFGLAAHIKSEFKKEKFIGTLRYMSRQVMQFLIYWHTGDIHSCQEMTWRASGFLPWQKKFLAPDVPKSQSLSAEYKRRVLNCKESCNIAELCAGLPPEFAEYLLYVRNLAKEPNYEKLRSIFRRCGAREFGLNWNQLWDWNDFDWIQSKNFSNVDPLQKGIPQFPENHVYWTFLDSEKQDKSSSFFVNRPLFADLKHSNASGHRGSIASSAFESSDSSLPHQFVPCAYTPFREPHSIMSLQRFHESNCSCATCKRLDLLGKWRKMDP